MMIGHTPGTVGAISVNLWGLLWVWVAEWVAPLSLGWAGP